jgi:hypothetical protein
MLAATGVQDRVADPLQIRQDRVVPEADDSQPGSLDVGGSPRIVGELIGMLAAVEFHDDAGFHAEEVEEIGTPGDLPLPLPPTQTTRANSVPKLGFSVGVVPPKLAGASDLSGTPEGADLGHGPDVNICGTSLQADRPASPSPYPLPLRFAGGEEVVWRWR